MGSPAHILMERGNVERKLDASINTVLDAQLVLSELNSYRETPECKRPWYVSRSTDENVET